MAVTTHDTVFRTKPRKGRSKGMAAIRKLRRALARRRLEEMQEELAEEIPELDDLDWFDD